MFHQLRYLFLGFIFLTGYSQAGEMDACYQANFKQIDRILDLPPEVIGLVYANTNGERDLSSRPIEEKEKIQSGNFSLGIADRGGPFSSSCSTVGDEASARLVMAAASEKCIFVAIEHGGAAHGAGMRVFLRENESWVRGDKFDHPRAYLMYQGKFDTDFPLFIAQANYELGYAFKHGFGVKKILLSHSGGTCLALKKGTIELNLNWAISMQKDSGLIKT